MARKYSSVAPDWWDYTTLDSDLIEAAAQVNSGRNTGALETGL